MASIRFAIVRRTTLSLSMLVLFTACGDSRASGEAFGTACKGDTNMPPKVCDCLAELADAELSDPALRWLTASISGNESEAARLREGMPLEDLT